METPRRGRNVSSTGPHELVEDALKKGYEGRILFVVSNRWALGDGICLTALVRDVYLNHNGRFRIRTSGHYGSVLWKNNPYVSQRREGDIEIPLKLDYGRGISASSKGTKVHFLTWFHRHFSELTGISCNVLFPKGDLHLDEQERLPVLDADLRYWVVVAGGKRDMTAKIWPASRFQELVDRMNWYGLTCVQVGASGPHHLHPSLVNCINFVGKTGNERDLFRLIYHSEGVVCGVTAAMHIAAVFDKPCVVIAGGREEPWWEAYTNSYGQFGPFCEPVRVQHRYLHTVSLLDCCKDRGCWKSHVVPFKPSHFSSEAWKLCKKPIRSSEPVPTCLDMITVDHVIEAVMSYYEDGTLPPIGKPKLKYPLPPEAPRSPAPPSALPGEIPPNPTVPVPIIQTKTNIAMEKVTIMVLGFGDYPSLIYRCLEGILDTVPRRLMDLRVALNQPCRETEIYVDSLHKSGRVSKVYTDYGARRKYPAMREMLYDNSAQLTTRYMIWFDDDSYPVSRSWLEALFATIAENHPLGARLYGRKMVHDLAAFASDTYDPRIWFQSAPWWRNRPFKLKNSERTAPNGSCITFVAGWFWAAEIAALKEAQVPDIRLNHNGGDIVIGAQIDQAGYLIKNFNSDKEYVFTPPKDQGGRRGYSEPFPWSKSVQEPHYAKTTQG